MQAQVTQQRRGRGRGGPSGGLGRALRYLGRHPRTTAYAYGALLVATVAQLAVPQLVQNMIDAITRGSIARTILGLPQDAQPLAVERLGSTLEQLQLDQNNAER